MPMEVELTDVDTSTLDENAVSPADLINGRGEAESQPMTTLGSNEHLETIGRGEEDQSASEFSTVSEGGEIRAIDSDVNQDEGASQPFNSVTSPGHTDLMIEPEKLDRWIDLDEGKALMARYEAEDKHKEELFQAKQEHTAAALARAAAEDAYKAAKSHEKACLATLSALIARGPDYPKPASVNQGGGDNDSAIDQAVRNDKSSPTIPLDDLNADQTWRSIPIAPMLEGIKGMGDKKREAILSLTPTLGDFEDLRGKASQSHKALYEVMPKGVGRAMADELEERALSAMSKHQAEVERRNQPGGGDDEAEPAEPASDEPVSASVASADAEPEYEDVEDDDLDSDDSADTYSDADVEG